jgi:hypothetical protein
MVVIVDRPKGPAASACVHFDCDEYWTNEFLALVITFHARGLGTSIRNTDIQLTDCEGHRFTVQPGVSRKYGLVFVVPDTEAIERLRFNDPAYYLSLRICFDLGGPRVIDVPRLDPVVDRSTLVGDTAGYAIAMVLVFGILYLSPVVSLILVGQGLWRWRRSRAAPC